MQPLAAALVTWHFDRQPGPIELTEFLKYMYMYMYLVEIDQKVKWSWEACSEGGGGCRPRLNGCQEFLLSILQNQQIHPSPYPLCRHASSILVDGFLLPMRRSTFAR